MESLYYSALLKVKRNSHNQIKCYTNQCYIHDLTKPKKPHWTILLKSGRGRGGDREGRGWFFGCFFFYKTYLFFLQNRSMNMQMSFSSNMHQERNIQSVTAGYIIVGAWSKTELGVSVNKLCCTTGC